MKGLRDAGAADARGAHLCEHLVQPLQGAVQVQLDPAGGAGHRLSPGGEQHQHGVSHRQMNERLTNVDILTMQTELASFMTKF